MYSNRAFYIEESHGIIDPSPLDPGTAGLTKLLQKTLGSIYGPRAFSSTPPVCHQSSRRDCLPSYDIPKTKRSSFSKSVYAKKGYDNKTVYCNRTSGGYVHWCPKKRKSHTYECAKSLFESSWFKKKDRGSDWPGREEGTSFLFSGT